MFDFINSFLKNHFSLLPKYRNNDTGNFDWINSYVEKSDTQAIWLALAAVAVSTAETYDYLKNDDTDDYEDDDYEDDYYEDEYS